MLFFWLGSWVSVALLLIGWGALGSTVFFPLGAFAAVTCIYFSYAEALLWLVPLGLLLESLLPLPMGSVTLPLVGATLLLQLAARHQFRAGIASRVLLGGLLQTVVSVSLSLVWPPQTVAGASLLTVEILAMGIFAGVLTPLLLFAAEEVARRGLELNLESRLKDL